LRVGTANITSWSAKAKGYLATKARDTDILFLQEIHRDAGKTRAVARHLAKHGWTAYVEPAIGETQAQPEGWQWRFAVTYNRAQHWGRQCQKGAAADGRWHGYV